MKMSALFNEAAVCIGDGEYERTVQLVNGLRGRLDISSDMGRTLNTLYGHIVSSIEGGEYGRAVFTILGLRDGFKAIEDKDVVVNENKVVLCGAGGHAKVVIEIVRGKYEVCGVTDIGRVGMFCGVPVLGTDEVLGDVYKSGVRKAVITVGSVGDASVRVRLWDMLNGLGFELINAVHLNAVISGSAVIGKGNVFMAGSVVNAGAVIGNNCIINTGAIIEHDCVIGNHVHIATGARLAGGVEVMDGAHIGIGASVKEGCIVGRGCIVGGGAMVVRSLVHGGIYVGVPAKMSS